MTLRKLVRTLFSELLLALFILPVALHAQATAASSANLSAADSQIQADMLKSLKSNHYKNVTVSVSNGVVSLGGSVSIYADKEEADKKAHHLKQAAAIRDVIQVDGPTVPDAVLYKKLSEKIAWDRIGYGYPGIREVTPFNAIDVHVQNGAVMLTGHAYGPVDKDSAAAIAAFMPGVKDVIDEVEVDPVSNFDDRSRLATYRAIYGFPPLNRYGADPAKPIRITVINGTVILSGVVDNQTDKQLAYMRANAVPNVFKVINNLQVAGKPVSESNAAVSVSK